MAQAGAGPCDCVGPSGAACPGVHPTLLRHLTFHEQISFIIWFHFFHSLGITSYHT